MIIRQRIRCPEQFVREMLNRCSIPTVSSSGLFFRLLELWPASMHLLQALSECICLLGPKDFDLKGSITLKKKPKKTWELRIPAWQSTMISSDGVTPTDGTVLCYRPPAHPLITSCDTSAQRNREPQSNQRARAQEKTCARTPDPHVAAVSSLTLRGDTNQPSSCKFPSQPFVLGEVSAITIFNERGDIEC